MSLLRAFLSLFRRRAPQDRPDPMQEVDADLARQEPTYTPIEEAPMDTPTPTEDTQPTKKKGPLVALVGASAAAALAVMIAKDESGRTVEATVTQEGQLEVRHVRGPQYLKAYTDIVGVLTICDGDTKNVRPGMVETEQGCTERLERQLVAHAGPVLRCVPALARPERENQLVSSVSLAYNIGTNGFCRSTAARRFNAGDWRGGCDAFMRFNRGTFSKPQPNRNCHQRPNGLWSCEVRGLTLRRERERALCLKGLS